MTTLEPMRVWKNVALALGATLVLTSACSSPTQTPATTAPTASPSVTTVATPTGPFTPSATAGIGVDRQTLPPVSPEVPGFVAAPAGEGLDGYLAQKPNWKACGHAKCATITVPMDYANPSAQAITLAVQMKAATKTPRLGVLFMNPGGPGAAAQWMVDSFSGGQLDQFDLVGIDPRGSGDSTPIYCGTDKQTDALLGMDFSPDDPKELSDLIAQARSWAASCWESNGEYLRHLSSVDIVRDFDLVRRLLGEDKINYLGYSYGTMLGATYAELFPDNVAHMVLDSPVSLDETSPVFQSAGFELAFTHFAAWCAQKGCSSAGIDLGTTGQQVHDAVAAWMAGLDAKPVPVGDRELTQSLALTGIAGLLYRESDWTSLRSALLAAMKGTGDALLGSADDMNSRKNNGTYGSMAYGLAATWCLDTRDRGINAAMADWETQKRDNGMFGAYTGPDVICPQWPVAPMAYLDFTAAQAPPIVVIGSTGDPATPYAEAQTVSTHLKTAVLVTYDGEGHGTFGGTSQCIDDLVFAYFLQGTVPAADTHCK